MEHKYIVGVDVGGTKTAITLASLQPLIAAEDIHKCILDKLSFATPVGDDSAQAIRMIIDGVYKLMERNRITGGMLAAIGISCGGPVDSKHGIICSPPNLYGWDNVPIVRLLQAEFGVKVALQNDANACALAEWKFGAGIGTQHMIFLTMGTGMGAGLILNGKLYSGTNDMAGEVGHVRLSENGPVGFGKAGSFEGFCSGGGIAQLATAMALEKLQCGQTVGYCKSKNEIASITAKSVSDAAEAGDTVAREVYDKVGQYLGKGLSILIDILNPEMIVIGSIFCRSHNLLWQSVQQVMQKEAIATSNSSCKVVPAMLGDSVGDFASVTVALYALQSV